MAEEISTADFINNLDVNKLPDNPAAHGMKAAQVKEKFFGPIYEGFKRLLSEIQNSTNNDKIPKALINGIIGRVRLIQSAETKKIRYNVKIQYTDASSDHNTVSFNMALYSDVYTDIDGVRDLLMHACKEQSVLILDQVNPDSTVTPLSIEYGDDWYQFSISYIDTDNNLRYIAFTPGMEEITVESTDVLSRGISEETDPTVPAWAKQTEKPKYTASEVGAATPAEVESAVADEKTEREAADTSIRSAVAENKGSIETLNGNASTEGSVKKQIADAIAAIMENPDTSMNSIQELVNWVNNHASDALELSNKASANETAITKINTLLGTELPATTSAKTVIAYITEVAMSLADATQWVEDIETSDGSELLKPPTAQATKDYADKINSRVDLMGNNVFQNGEAIKELNGAAVGAPSYSDGTLTFPVIGTDERVFVDISDDMSGSGSTSSGGSCNCCEIPLQRVEWHNRDMADTGDETLDYDFTYTPISDNLMKAVIHVQPPTERMCGGYPSLVLTSEPPFGLNEEPTGGPYIEAANIYYDLRKTSVSYADDLSISVSKDSPNRISFYNSSYYLDIGNWFVEITVDINTREIWVVANEMAISY